MLDKEIERDLRAFIEKVDKLDDSRFLKTLKAGTTIKIALEKNIPQSVEFIGPSDEEIDAYTLTYRLFGQNNDRISVSRIAEVISSLALSQDLKSRFALIRDSLNKYLDGPTGQVIGGEKLSRRRIVDVFVYGHLAHLNAEKKATYDAWAADEVILATLKNEFIWTLGYVLGKHLCYLREICKDALLAYRIPWFKVPAPPTD